MEKTEASMHHDQHTGTLTAAQKPSFLLNPMTISYWVQLQYLDPNYLQISSMNNLLGSTTSINITGMSGYNLTPV